MEQASHASGSSHWGRTSNPFTLKLGDNVSSQWDTTLATTASDWSQAAVLDTIIVAGGTTPRTCKPTLGRVEVCGFTYGNTGWLSIAQIWLGGDHITQAVVKLNDTYFSTSPYNTTSWRNMVSCREVGHVLGLGNQDQDFNNPNLGSCMDYTSNPETNQHPNQHDYDMLEAIYAHLDSTTTVSWTLPGTPAAVMDLPAQWGERITAPGRIETFVRELGGGHAVMTRVSWALLE